MLKKNWSIGIRLVKKKVAIGLAVSDTINAISDVTHNQFSFIFTEHGILSSFKSHILPSFEWPAVNQVCAMQPVEAANSLPQMSCIAPLFYCSNGWHCFCCLGSG